MSYLLPILFFSIPPISAAFITYITFKKLKTNNNKWPILISSAAFLISLVIIGFAIGAIILSQMEFSR